MTLPGLYYVEAIIGFVLYFIPTIIAFKRKHRNKIPVGLTNFFFGWTIIGWIVCLIWAFSADVETKS